MLGDVTPTCFVPTGDVAAAARFYAEALGLEVIEETPFAVVVAAGATTIRITPVEGFTPPAHTLIGWTVPDAAVTMRGLRDRGVEPLRFGGMEQDADGCWHSPSGALVAWFADPDGNTLSITQMPD